MRFTLFIIQVREAQVAQYNFIIVVGAKEAEMKTVNIRTRDNEVTNYPPPLFFVYVSNDCE